LLSETQVLLGGGSAHIPGLVKAIARQHPSFPLSIVEKPETGALYGGLLSVSSLVHSLAFDLGIRTAGALAHFLQWCCLTKFFLYRKQDFSYCSCRKPFITPSQVHSHYGIPPAATGKGR